MRLVLCDRDAIDYWRRCSAPGGLGSYVGHVALVPRDLALQALPRRRSSPKLDPPTPALIDELRERGVIGDGPAHVLVTSPGSRREFLGVTCTLDTMPLPVGSLCPVYARGHLVEGVYVCSPLLALAQLARGLALHELVLLGLELCGSYRLLGGHVSYRCEPLFSKRELTSFVAGNAGRHGIVGLRAAAPWIAEGCASPAEAAVVAALALPLRLGGSGLGLPEFNPTIELSDDAAKLLGYHRITPDALWRHRSGSRHPGVPLEYDSEQFHSGRERIERDQRRRNAYVAAGMSVVVVRPEHLRDFAKFDALAASVRRGIGLRITRYPAGYPGRYWSLLTDLFRGWAAKGAVEHGDWGEPGPEAWD